jgi:hypothetical protein
MMWKMAHEAPAEFVASMIGQFYLTPQFSFRTLRELDSVLREAHFMWAMLGSRRTEYRAAGGPDFQDVVEHSGVKKAFKAATVELLCTRQEFLPVIEFWQEVDKRLGLDVYPEEFSRDQPKPPDSATL